MKLRLLYVLCIVFLGNMLLAQNKKDSLPKKDTLPAFFGISHTPGLNWGILNITGNSDGKLKYDFDVNSLTSIEGNAGIRKIGLRFGVSAYLDNNLAGKIYQYSGYLSLKNYWIRIQKSEISGTTFWEGQLPAGFSPYQKFSYNYFNIDLLRTSKSPNKYRPEPFMGWYWGLSYSSLGFPLKISTLTTPGGRENQIFGVSAYDSLFSLNFYSIGFGFDLLRQLCMSQGKSGAGKNGKAMRFAMYASTQDKIGFGKGKLTNHAVRMGEALNPGKKMVPHEFLSVVTHYSLSVGFRYYYDFKPVFLIIAAGYELEGASVLSFGGAADTNTDLGFDANFFYINHGASLKLFVSWSGLKRK